MRKAGSCTKEAVLLRGCFFISFLYFHDVDFGSVIFEDANEVFCVQPDGGCVIIGMSTYLMAQKRLIEVEVNRVFFVIQKAERSDRARGELEVLQEIIGTGKGEGPQALSLRNSLRFTCFSPLTVMR